jgi:DNA-binding Lrp family transcriptional regulator
VARAVLSAVDEVLLGLLQRNARVTNKELARAAGIAESTCLERVRSLQQRGVIRGWHAEVDLAAIGRSIRALVNVRLHPKTTHSVHAFQTGVLAAPETISVRTVTGADDFIVEVAVPDVDRLRTFVLEVITSRPDVADARTSLVYEHQRKVEIEPLPETP